MNAGKYWMVNKKAFECWKTFAEMEEKWIERRQIPIKDGWIGLT